MSHRTRPAPPSYNNVVRATPRSRNQPAIAPTNPSWPTAYLETNAYRSQPPPAVQAPMQSPAKTQSFYNHAIQGFAPSTTTTHHHHDTNHHANVRRPPSPANTISSSISAMPHRRQHSGSSSTTMSSSTSSDSYGPTLPAGFTRPPRLREPSQYFSPMFLLSTSTRLEQGFPMSFPLQSEAEPMHPFMRRDVCEGDWFRFLDDFTRVACLPAQSNPPAYNSTEQIQLQPIQRLFNLWNQKFFNPRGVKIYLAQGPRLLAGTSNTANRQSPDWASVLALNNNSHGLKFQHWRADTSLEGLYRIVVVSL